MAGSTRRDKGHIRLNERDLHVLTWIGEQYTVRFDHLQLLLGKAALGATKEENLLSYTRTRHIIERWVTAGLVEHRKIFAHVPAYIWLTRLGMRELGLPYKEWEPKAATLMHLHWVNWVRFKTEERSQKTIWRSERAIRYALNMLEPGQRPLHIPDAEVEDEHTIALEVELTQKERVRLQTIFELLTASHQTIWYFVHPSVFPVVSRVRDSLASSLKDRIKLYQLPIPS